MQRGEHSRLKLKQVFKAIWQKAASPTSHSSRLQINWPDLDLSVNGSLGPQESALKRHLDRFSRYCTVHQCNNTQTQMQPKNLTKRY